MDQELQNRVTFFGRGKSVPLEWTIMAEMFTEMVSNRQVDAVQLRRTLRQAGNMAAVTISAAFELFLDNLHIRTSTGLDC